ncbi:aspartate-semialdehyde dehydrogenase [Allofrancisella guangzhouensis]|uniref:Aspartate-semialdehyde dehydrogenase n=1 Tax=Allofrancisella guangzhouensis TaxID=594679 RepID=A0A0A8E4Z1_9GAMM|nr:aspartate-semialdehyde dehydrogenase [Allofrancisella guangzhouensis]AJC48642.1 aspartate-semialdehyde dehydrogenase [Allofrancisella guangzhouensis]MBK2026970.1 aspartate-semialdehyde dehydrogenase [Allofrancisella guangzhouensis]MBK2044750.1 aspartate-semialdehyde dehydrogenase [Allofrancisella guangzhouensis]MBK2045864.1 aspartate-semialdehyde dehydrogenase [Allofrancisella guangzhouensis]
MNKKIVGFVGWRGMVGSVLIDRIINANDFNNFEAVFFTTSQLGEVTKINNKEYVLEDSFNLKELFKVDILVTCQGSEYSQEILPKLRAQGWQGFWIDAASKYRMADDSIIVLDPINMTNIQQAIKDGIRNFIGGNCTVSLMMLAIDGLLKDNLIESISVMSYQAVSGAGARAMVELLDQSRLMSKNLDIEASDSLTLEKKIRLQTQAENFPCSQFIAPMAFNLIPFIDTLLENGQSREEYKAQAELNKILATRETIAVDGICVRVPVLRAHSQALTIKLKKQHSLDEVEKIIRSANDYIRFVPNNPQDTARYLTPLSVTGTLDIAVGRLKTTNISKQHIQLFTVGDQLLWGAAEPIRRMLNICLANNY